MITILAFVKILRKIVLVCIIHEKLLFKCKRIVNHYIKCKLLICRRFVYLGACKPAHFCLKMFFINVIPYFILI